MLVGTVAGPPGLPLFGLRPGGSRWGWAEEFRAFGNQAESTRRWQICRACVSLSRIN